MTDRGILQSESGRIGARADGERVPAFFIHQLVSAYSLAELRHLAHVAEYELYACEQIDDNPYETAFWRERLKEYKAAVARILQRQLAAKAQPVQGRTVVRIDPELVKSRAELVAIVEEHVQLTRMGHSLKGLCPFHAEKTPSFIVFPERQNWHCFGCGANGDVISFVCKIHNASFGEGLRILAQRTGVPIPETKKQGSRWGVEI